MWCKVQRYHREIFGMHLCVWRVLLVFFLRKGKEVVFSCACMCCFCECVRRVDDSFGGQCCTAAE